MCGTSGSRDYHIFYVRLDVFFILEYIENCCLEAADESNVFGMSCSHETHDLSRGILRAFHFNELRLQMIPASLLTEKQHLFTYKKETTKIIKSENEEKEKILFHFACHARGIE